LQFHAILGGRNIAAKIDLQTSKPQGCFVEVCLFSKFFEKNIPT